jgi:hypothetical protein
MSMSVRASGANGDSTYCAGISCVDTRIKLLSARRCAAAPDSVCGHNCRPISPGRTSLAESAVEGSTP